MEEGLKKRLVGAGVLASLAVVFVPMLIDPEPMVPREITETNIPARPSPGLGSQVRPMGPVTQPLKPPGARSDSGLGSGFSGVYEPPTDEYTLLDIPPETALVEDPAPTEAYRPPPAPIPGAAADALPPPQGWVLQVGSFSNADNARRLVGELQGRGYAGFMEEADVRGQVLYRVLVGPEARRESADQLVSLLEDWMRDRKLAGRVRQYP